GRSGRRTRRAGVVQRPDPRVAVAVPGRGVNEEAARSAGYGAGGGLAGPRGQGSGITQRGREFRPPIPSPQSQVFIRRIMYRSSPYDRANLIADFDSIRISLASPEKIRS